MQANTLKGKRGQLGGRMLDSSFKSPGGSRNASTRYGLLTRRKLSPASSEGSISPIPGAVRLDDSGATFALDGAPAENFWEGVRRMADQKRFQSHTQHSISDIGDAAKKEDESPAPIIRKISSLKGAQLAIRSFPCDAEKYPFICKVVSIAAEKACVLAKITLIPKESSWKLKWDVFVGLLIFYSVMVVPLRIGFPIAELKFVTSSACWIDSVVDICFVIDIIFCFNQAVEIHVDGEEIIVDDRIGIALKYLKTWFIIDFLSTFPFDKIVSGGSWSSCAVEEEEDNGGGSARAVKLIRVFRLIRLLKLMRILKLGRIMEKLPLDDINPNIFELGTLVLKTTFVAHLLCCFWFFTASDTFVDPEDPSDLTWTVNFNMLNQTLEMQYVTSFYWTIATMLAVGYGDVHAVNSGERIYSILAQLIGSVVFGAVIGTVSNLVRSRDPQGRARKERMDELKHYLTERSIPPALSKKAREALDYYMHHRSVFNEAELLGRLPAQLYKIVVYQIYDSVIDRIPVLKSLTTDFVARLVPQLKPCVASKYEVIIEEGELADEIDFVVRGEVLLYKAEGDLEAHDEDHELKSSNVNIFDFDPHQVLYGQCMSRDGGGFFGDYELQRRTARVFTAVSSSIVSYMSVSRSQLDEIGSEIPLALIEFIETMKPRNDAMHQVLLKSNPSFVPVKQRHHKVIRKEKLFQLKNGKVVQVSGFTNRDNHENPTRIAGGMPLEIKTGLLSANNFIEEHESQWVSDNSDVAMDSSCDADDDSSLELEGKGEITHATRRKDPQNPSINIYAEESTNQLWQRWIIDPNSARKQQWDIAIGALIVYSVTVIPFRIGFDINPVGLQMIVERAIDGCFLMDIAVNFRTAFHDITDDCLVTDFSSISQHYLRTWFGIDFFSCIDIELIASLFVSNDTSDLKSTKLIKAIRLFRLLKLVRLMKLGRYLEIVEDELGIPPALFDLLMLFIQVAFLAHVFACFFHLVAVENSSGTDIEDGDTWFRDQDLFPHQTNSEVYIGAIYWAFTTMTTVGYGDICAHPESIAEKCYAIVMMAIGATVFAFVLANVAALSDSMSGTQAQVRAQLVHVNEYLEEKKVSLGLCPAIKAHWRFLTASSLGMNEAGLLEQLPTRMAQQILFIAHEHVIHHICLFRCIQKKSIILHIFRLMQPCFFYRGTVIFDEGGSANHVYFVTNGKVALTKRIITGNYVKMLPIGHIEAGGFVGHSGLVQSARQPYTATSIEIGCECFSLGNDAISRVAIELPFVAIHLQFAISEAMAEQDNKLSAEARALRKERLRDLEEPTVKIVGNISDFNSTVVKSPARSRISMRSNSSTSPSSSLGRSSSMSRSPAARSMSRLESQESASDSETKGTPVEKFRFVYSNFEKLITPFRPEARVATKDDQNEGTIFDGTEPLNCVLKTDDTVLINSRSMNCTRSIPRSKSCPDFGSSNGVSSKRIKGQDNSIFNNGVGIEEAALRTQGDSRTIYRNRSISSSTFEG